MSNRAYVNRLTLNDGDIFSQEVVVNVLMVKRRRTKCRSCFFYRRVKKGLWNVPDLKSGAGICLNPRQARCKYINTIIGEEDYYEPMSYTKRAVVDHHNFIAGWRQRSFKARALSETETGGRPK